MSVTLKFEIAKTQDGHSVGLQIDGEVQPPTKFRFNSDGGAIRPALDNIDAGSPSLGDIRTVGEALWPALATKELLAGEEVARASENGKQLTIRLNIPQDFQWLPWESLHARERGFLSGRVGEFAIVHDPPPEVQKSIAPFTPWDNRPLRMLVIIPERTGLNIASERDIIVRAHAGLGHPAAMKVLAGRVTAELLEKTLKEQRGWDIVHYMGHGRINADKDLELDLNAEDGTPLPYPAEVFAEMVRDVGVRLAVMNCCYGTGESTSGALTGFGPLLMREGIPAVISMRYAISDESARRFSESFYYDLFGGLDDANNLRGRVDRAVEKARAALRRDAANDRRGFITPVLHLAEGYHQLFEFPAYTPPRVILPDPLPADPIPVELIEAIKTGDCVLVAGVGVLPQAMLRHSNAPGSALFGPRQFADTLAADPACLYPRQPDFSLCDQAGEWMSTQLLGWVAQYNQAQRKSRGPLLKRIQEHYAGKPVPPTFSSIARWPIPAVFYVHFDGFLERCVLDGKSHLRTVVRELDKPIELADATHDPLCLVLVRGSFSAKAMLTEDDHDQLATNIHRMDPRLSGVAKKANRSVFFLGVSARDPVIRQLSQQILEKSDRQQGPTFFAATAHDAVDDAYWAKYDIRWLPQEPAAIVAQISEGLGIS